MAAADLAEVVARDPQPLVALRGREHPLEQLAVAGLELLALAQSGASVLDPARQRVADGLQLTEVERPWLAGEGRHAGVDADAREGLGGEAREDTLEVSDLAPQLGAGGELVAAYQQSAVAVSIQQMRHGLPRV